MAGAYGVLDEAVHDAEAEAEAALSAVSASLLAVEAAIGPRAAQQQIALAGEQADAARTACRDFELELRGAALPPQEAARLSQSYEEAARRLQRHLSTLDFLQRTHEREALLAGAASQQGLDADKASPSALIALGVQVQVESQLAVSRMSRVVESSKQVGAQTLVALEAQHGRLSRLRDTVGAQEAQYAQAEYELKEMAQGALGDSVTQSLLVLILLSVCFVITWRLSTLSTPAPPSSGYTPDGWRRVVLSPLSTLEQ